jgi:protein SCO1
VLALALVTGCASTPTTPAGTVVSLNDNGGYSGSLVDPAYPLPDSTFSDTDGAPWSFARDSVRPVTLVTFGYTSCPDVCSAQLADLTAALRRVDPGARSRTQVVWITVDPARDTPEVIRDYLDRFDPTIVGLTASEQTIDAAAAQLGVALTGTNDVGRAYEVGHGAQIIGFGGDDASVVWVPGTPVADLRADISRLASTS